MRPSRRPLRGLLRMTKVGDRKSVRHGEERRSRVSNHAIALVLLLAACAVPQPEPPPALPPAPVPPDGSIEIVATPVPLNAGDPSQDRVGRFVYAGGVALTSADTSRLHGLSDFKILPDGTLAAVSDEGDLLSAKLQLGADEQLIGLTDAILRPLTGPDGKPLQGKENADAEGFAVMGNGERLVSFERNHRIWRYGADGGVAEAPMPQTLFSDNEGMEALSPYPPAGADAYLVGGEEGETWLCHLATKCESAPRLNLPSLDYGLTSIAAFDGAAIAVLYRAYDPIRGPRAVIRIIGEPLRAKPAPVIVDSFALEGALTRDNFEGLALVRNAKGGARLYLLSDDNFSGSQRTLLMAFDWTPAR